MDGAARVAGPASTAAPGGGLGSGDPAVGRQREQGSPGGLAVEAAGHCQAADVGLDLVGTDALEVEQAQRIQDAPLREARSGAAPPTGSGVRSTLHGADEFCDDLSAGVEALVGALNGLAGAELGDCLDGAGPLAAQHPDVPLLARVSGVASGLPPRGGCGRARALARRRAPRRP